jgi:subtilisin family serine protease
VAAIWRATWLPAMRFDPRRPRRDRLTGGLALAILLLIMGSALSLNGVQLLLMLLLPAAAWAIVATGALGWATAGLLLGPLLWTDPDALSLLALDALLVYSFWAAGIAVGLGWLLSLASLLPQADPVKFMSHRPAWASAAAMLLLVGLIYLRAGTPGFYGDRLFVVLADQADLAELEPPDTLTARRTQIYRTLTDHAGATQGDLRAALDRVGVAYTPYYLVNGLEVEAGLPVRLWLQLRGDVGEIMPSPILRPTRPFDFNLGEIGLQPTAPPENLTRIGADRVWQELGITGAGIVIGQSDSGVQGDHPEFAARYRGATTGDDFNWLDPWEKSPSPIDLDGHGTHTLGTILGETVGVAPGATWFACANLVRNLGNPAKYLDCMQFMLAPHPQTGDPLRDGDPSLAADVLNNSWGCPADFEGCSATVFAPAVDALTQAGIFVVASAGNSGPTCSSVTDPLAIYAASFTVGAADNRGQLADFSSNGPVTVDGSGRIKPDLLAPGVDVLSAWPGSSYAYASGTSMAGPHVAGVVALMWSANSALRGDVARTRALLEATTQPFAGSIASAGAAEDGLEVARPLAADACLTQVDPTQTPNNVAGFGIVDAYAAVQAALP